MADIAAKAGVHVTTVSLALRGHPRIPDATRKRIRKLADRLGYRPDAMLQALVAHRERVFVRRNIPTLAYVTNWMSRFGWKDALAHLEFYLGAQGKAAELGFKIEHFSLKDAGMTPSRLGQMLFARGIRGIILASHAMEMGDSLQLEWDHFSAVKIDYFPREPGINIISNNQRDAVRAAVQNAVRLGYRRIGFVMHGGWDRAAENIWTAGFLCEQQYIYRSDRIPVHLFAGVPPLRPQADDGSPSTADPLAFKRWYKAHRPEVIISRASFVLPHLEAMGVRVPQDVAFIDVFREPGDAGTAGIIQKHRAVGETAVEILSGQLQRNQFGVPAIQTSTYIDGEWIEGESCPRRQPTSGHIWDPGWDVAAGQKGRPPARLRGGRP
ncbi:MAG TPA: LacI family DNA-binding transcriptional regulator [Opitutaceae bacterium]|jgi:LacI family transcriptional regulator